MCSRYTPPKYPVSTAPKTALDTTFPPSTDRSACRPFADRPSSPSPSPFSHPIDHGQCCGSPHAIRAPVVIHVALAAETQRRRVRTACVSGQWSADSGQRLGLALWQCGRARPTVSHRILTMEAACRRQVLSPASQAPSFIFSPGRSGKPDRTAMRQAASRKLRSLQSCDPGSPLGRRSHWVRNLRRMRLNSPMLHACAAAPFAACGASPSKISDNEPSIVSWRCSSRPLSIFRALSTTSPSSP